jgi:8-oxo-dGTP pyrophosphatase MutT (NUDIX family)
MFEIPEDRLPPGFAETVEDPPARPAPARPAATIVPLRDGGGEGLEVLLMRRHARSGFVPGAWVFPGGRVDQADSAPPLYQRIRGLPSDPEPGSAFWTAALRELFEETGVLLARDSKGEWMLDASSHRPLEARRSELMADETSLMDILDALELDLDASGMVHIAHWVTPIVEPRRYDTHFFAAALPPGHTAAADPREMTEAVWLSPAAALRRFEAGDLPMVFPTIRTLEELREYQSTEDVIDSFRHRTVTRILPRLVRTETGVAIVVDRS